MSSHTHTQPGTREATDGSGLPREFLPHPVCPSAKERACPPKLSGPCWWSAHYNQRCGDFESSLCC